jgi:hypothetical protein
MCAWHVHVSVTHVRDMSMFLWHMCVTCPCVYVTCSRVFLISTRCVTCACMSVCDIVGDPSSSKNMRTKKKAQRFALMYIWKCIYMCVCVCVHPHPHTNMHRYTLQVKVEDDVVRVYALMGFPTVSKWDLRSCVYMSSDKLCERLTLIIHTYSPDEHAYFCAPHLRRAWFHVISCDACMDICTQLLSHSIKVCHTCCSGVPGVLTFDRWVSMRIHVYWCVCIAMYCKYEHLYPCWLYMYT